jgi:hypothetical protein
MTNSTLRFLSAIVALASLAVDVWLFSLRCSTSPPIDPSRLGFGIFIQSVGVLAPLIATKFGSDAGARKKFAFGAILCMVLALPMVRTSMLLSDTVTDKFYPSAGYLCPGVRF